MKSIASCIGVDFSDHEKEVAQLLSRIEKKKGVVKPVPHRTPPAVQRRREPRRLEFGMNYDKSSTQTSREASKSLGLVVPYVWDAIMECEGFAQLGQKNGY